jgi:hypothetical protein
MSYPNSILNPLLSAFMSMNDMCSDGLGVRVEDLLPKGQWFESPLEQFVLKTRAINSILRNRNMIGKILTWWENSMDEGIERYNTSGGGGLPTLPGLYLSTIQSSRRGFYRIHVCEGEDNWRQYI